MEFVDTSRATNWISDKLGLCQKCKQEKEAKKLLSQLKATNSTSRRELEETES